MGGQRNTYNLDADQVQNLWRAFHYSDPIRLPIQSPLTILWRKTHFGDSAVPEAFTKAKERGHHWLARRGIPWTAVFVHENSPQNGVHTHMLCHVPPALQEQFAQAMQSCVEGRTRNAVQLNISGGGGPRGWLRYMCKGIDPQDHDCRIVAQQYGIQPREAGQGWLTFKRSGTTANIGSSARATHGIRSLPNVA